MRGVRTRLIGGGQQNVVPGEKEMTAWRVSGESAAPIDRAPAAICQGHSLDIRILVVSAGKLCHEQHLVPFRYDEGPAMAAFSGFQFRELTHAAIGERNEVQRRTVVDAHDYRLLVGLYRLDTGARLPAFTADGQSLPNYAVDVFDAERKVD